MANQRKQANFGDVESRFESKVDLTLQPMKVIKVDEQLSIEFTDIKYEPIDHFENYQTVKGNESKCISCNTSFQHFCHLDGIATYNSQNMFQDVT